LTAPVASSHECLQNGKLLLCQRLDNMFQSLSREFRSSSAIPDEGAKCVEVAAAHIGKRISLHSCVVALTTGDLLVLAVAGAVAVIVQHQFRLTNFRFEDWQLQAICFAVFSHFFWTRLWDVYHPSRILDRGRALRRLPLALFATFALLLVIAVATKSAETYSRLWFFSWAVLSLSVIFLIRCAFFTWIDRALEQGACVHRALSIGVFCDPISSREIERQSRREVRVIESLKFSNIADFFSLAEVVADGEIDQIYLAAPWEDIPLILAKLELLSHLSTRVYVLPSNRSIDKLVRSVSDFGGRLSFCAIEESIHGWSLWLKRVEDFIISAIGLLALAPLFVLVALMIRLESPGPVFFRQTRTGFNGRPFQLWKFRSMYAEMTDYHAETQTSRDDPRVTCVGRVIRRLSIDELPQLINVFQGSMSIVGPRPHALATKAEGRNLEELVDYYAVRHRVKPGMTGWAQVHGLRGELDSVEKLQKRVDYDIEYIDLWTIWLDIKIILKTVALVFRDKSAY